MADPLAPMLSTISITTPTPNEQVESPFYASGTYASDEGIVVVKWQIQKRGDPVDPNGWNGGTQQGFMNTWSTQASALTGGNKTFFAGVFLNTGGDPLAVASVPIDITAVN